MAHDLNMEFVECRLGAIGDLQTEDRFGWVEVVLKFKHPRFEAYPTVSINVPVQYERTWSIEKVRTAAFETAIAALEDVYALINQHGHQLRPEGLPGISDE